MTFSEEITNGLGTRKRKKFHAECLKKKKQKTSEETAAMPEVEIQPNPALDENQAGRGSEKSGNRRLTSESTPIEQGHDFATSTGTLDREEMSELSDISTENTAAAGSPTDNSMLHGVTGKVVTFSSFSERVKNTLRNFFPFIMGMGTGDEVDTQEEDEDNEENQDFESQVSLNSSTHENEASTNMETVYSDRFGAVTTINQTIDGMQRSREFMTMTNSDKQPGKDRRTASVNTPAEPEADYEETSRQRGKTRISTSTTLPGTNRVTPSPITPLGDNGSSMEES